MLTALNVEKTYDNGSHALRGVSLELQRGKALGLVGESGCGKSTLARLLCRLDDTYCGELSLDGTPYTGWNSRELLSFRKRVQLVFQESSACLDPRATVYDSLREPLDNFGTLTRAQKRARIRELLDQVEIPHSKLTSYPHQLSGGQRQRIVIARALAVRPDYLICDEPVSSLDMDTQGQIVKLLQGLKAQSDMGLMFISHDLSVAAKICDSIAVMFAGKIVEELPVAMIGEAAHPYTRSLFSYVFELEECCCTNKFPQLGSVASRGCAYSLQCPHATEVCRSNEPEFSTTCGPRVACHHSVGGRTEC